MHSSFSQLEEACPHVDLQRVWLLAFVNSERISASHFVSYSDKYTLAVGGEQAETYLTSDWRIILPISLYSGRKHDGLLVGFSW